MIEMENSEKVAMAQEICKAISKYSADKILKA